MSGLELVTKDRATILVHFYRAMVGRADVWRTRMDATTNWAIGSTAAVASFALGSPDVPHYVIYIATWMTIVFLSLEARRLTFYHLWQQRVLWLERALVRPAIAPAAAGLEAGEGQDLVTLEAEFAATLGRTVPTMGRRKAIARRLRRVYLYLFAVHLIAWIVKLANHPSPATTAGEIIERAHIAMVPGWLVLTSTGLLLAGGVVLAIALGGVDRDPA